MMNIKGKQPGRKRRRSYIIWPIIVCLVAILAYGTYQLALRSTNPIPASLRPQLTFSPFIIPSSSSLFTTSDYAFKTAEGNVKTLSYIIHTKTKQDITLSEYTQPQQFTDIPQYKDAFLTSIGQYDNVQTANGTMYLCRSTHQNNQQIVVMLERGLIVFLYPSKDLDTTVWHQIGDQLQIQAVN